ncbi:MAG: FAD-binding protein [Streptosporangiales bacterium]|nr:FAD-binding protein [Streptosporangiales bacterium]
MTAQTLPLTTPADALRALRARLAGSVYVPGDAEYAGKESYRGAPAFVVEAATPAEVRSALGVAREYGLPLTVQSTGHGTIVAPTGGLLLRTSRMARVLVDPDRRIARVGAGARWSEVIAAAEPFGLAPLSGDTPSVGVVGYTLGGGLSWLSRRYGFAADSLLRIDLVTADGRYVTATEHRNPDLFWAVRGGGGNFGVVTSLEFRLYHVPEVYGGSAVFPIERAAAALTFLAEHGEELPDALSLSLVVARNAGEDGPGLIVRAVHADGADAGERALRPLLDIVGAPVSGGFRPMRYSEVSGIGGTPPRGFAMYDRLSPELVERVVGSVTRPDSGVSALEIKHWGGAIAWPTDPAPGPVSHRDVPFVMKLDASPHAVADLTRYATGHSYLNFLSDTTRTARAYTEDNYRRLRGVKAAYDPDNMFHRNHNIPPVLRAG